MEATRGVPVWAVLEDGAGGDAGGELAFQDAQREEMARGQVWRVTVAINPYAVLTIALCLGVEVLGCLMAWGGRP